jgi:twitching motility two-component system response regulator PilH
VPKTVLTVDDNPAVITVVQKLLCVEGYEVITASTGEEGYEKAVKFKPDVVLLDMDLPGIDGGEVASMLLNNPETREIPIIFVTGLATEMDISSDHRIAGRYYIAKPFKRDGLLSVLEKVIGGSR